MKRTTLRLSDETDGSIGFISRKLACSRQEAVVQAVGFLSKAIAARKGQPIEVPNGGEYEVEYR